LQNQASASDLWIVINGRRAMNISTRLRQRNSPATPEIPLLFEEMSFETVCFDSFILIEAICLK
jgi:hypothetical protein